MWLEIARQQYDSLPDSVQRQIDMKLDLLLDDPEQYGTYDKSSDQWTTDFGDGDGLIVYTVVHQNIKVIVLRLIA